MDSAISSPFNLFHPPKSLFRQLVRLPDLNRIRSSYVYLLEKEEDDHVTTTPSRIG